MLQLVNMEPSGDVALVVRGHLVLAAEPGLDDEKTVESAAEALAAALDEPLQVLRIATPQADEWTWQDALATLPSA